MALSASCFLVVTCAPTVSTLSREQVADIETESFRTSYETGFSAVAEALQDMGYCLINADRKTGILTTDWQVKQPSGLEVAFAIRVRTRFSVTVTKAGDGLVRVRARMMVQSSDPKFGWVDCRQNMSVEFYRSGLNWLFSVIKQRLQ